MKDAYIGIDLGITGAISAIIGDKVLCVYDLPVKNAQTKSRIEKKIDAMRLMRTIEQIYIAIFYDHDCDSAHVCIEKTQAMRDTAITAFSMGQTKGIVEAVFELEMYSFGYPVHAMSSLDNSIHWIQPQEWKKHFNLIKANKEDSRLMALSLYPNIAKELRCKKHHNRAESLLIADYGKFLLEKAL